MRILVYNIAYGTGGPKSYYDHINTASRYMRTSHTHLDEIMKFIGEADPDVLGLVEVDTGSYRTNPSIRLKKSPGISITIIRAR